jgi:hypothetical protein
MTKYHQCIESLAFKNCQLKWTEDEFNEKYKTSKTKIDIINSCGHDSFVQYSNFLYQNTGVSCKTCSSKRTGENKKCIICKYQDQEYKVIKAIQEYCKELLEFKVLEECTLADCVYRPFGSTQNVYMPLQIKTIQMCPTSCYTGFHFDLKNIYKDMFILCFCIEGQRMWLMNGNEITVRGITIGKYNSIYNKYELLPQELKHELINLYNSHITFLKSFEILNTPISNSNKKEQEFKIYRERLFPSLNFQYPEMNGSVYDCIINGCFKVQDKVASIINKKRKTSNIHVHISRKRFSKKDYQYQLGDNDFYWIHLPNKKGAYILPEMLLYNYGVICDKSINCLAEMSYFNPNSNFLDNKYKKDYNNYLFMYDKDIDRIVCLFENKNIMKKGIVNNINIIIVDRERIVIEKDNMKFHCISCQRYINKNNKYKLCSLCFKKSFKLEIKCFQCDTVISNECTKGLCKICLHKSYRIVERPPYEQLIKDIEELNFRNTGKKYGVSDNAIRKWIKNYEK